MEPKWVRVSRREPCLICGKADYCTRLSNGRLARCMRVESERPSPKGGWIHPTDDTERVAPAAPERLKNIGEIAKKMFLSPTAVSRREALASLLHVSPHSLRLLGVGVGFDHDGREFMSFPSRGKDGEVIGIVRRYWDGSKKTMRGTSNAGVFIVPGWWTLEGPVMVVEGASDVAALTTAGLCSIGRPSNTGGWSIICEYIKRRAAGRDVVVIGENDRKPERMGLVPGCDLECEGCMWCWPGRYGAIETASQIWARWKMCHPSYKDVRAWLTEAGDDFRSQILEYMEKP